MKRIIYFILLLVFLAPLVGGICGFTPMDDLQISLIGNEKGVPASLTMRELKAILQGEKQRWPDGTTVSIAFMKTSTPVGGATARKVLNLSGDELNKLWLALVFQGKAKAPTFFSSAAELEAYVNSTPGAIGFMDAGQTGKGRVITVDEKKSF